MAGSSVGPPGPVIPAAGLPTSPGAVIPYGGAPDLGSAPSDGQRVVGIAAAPSGDGYWLVSSSGRVFAFGKVRTYAAESRRGK